MAKVNMLLLDEKMRKIDLKTIFLLWLFAFPAWATETTGLRENESIRFTGTVEAIIGHSFGYVPPKIGATFKIDLKDLPDQALNFGSADKTGKSYIPLSGDLKILTVKRYNNSERPVSSIRLVSESTSHKVTIDIINNSGGEIANTSKLWVLIESQGHIIGIWQLLGEVEYIQAEP